MPIPGLKVLDEMIAGLPTNSAQRLELAKLRSEIEVKDRKIAELEAKLADLEPKRGVEVDAAKVLKIFFEQDDRLTTEQIAECLVLKKSVVQYHFDKLSEMGFIRCTSVWGGYDLQPAGREFVVKNGLA